MFRTAKTPSDQAPKLRCSFCNKTRDEVRKLIAGPTVYICDGCVQVCCDILADDHRLKTGDKTSLGAEPSPGAQPKTWLPSAAVCTFCGGEVALETALLIENRTLLCGACVQAIAATAREAQQSEPSDE
jgi:hypothetical protein